MKKLLMVIGSLALLGVIAVVAVEGYLRWQDPIGYRNLRVCSTIRPGATLDQLKAALGDPVGTSVSHEITWLHFQTASIAAGQIRAAVQLPTGHVVTLRCSEDGPDTWSLAERSASTLRMQSMLRTHSDAGR